MAHCAINHRLSASSSESIHHCRSFDITIDPFIRGIFVCFRLKDKSCIANASYDCIRRLGLFCQMTPKLSSLMVFSSMVLKYFLTLLPASRSPSRRPHHHHHHRSSRPFHGHSGLPFSVPLVSTFTVCYEVTEGVIWGIF